MAAVKRCGERIDLMVSEVANVTRDCGRLEAMKMERTAFSRQVSDLNA